MNNTDIWLREGAYGTDADPAAVASWRRAGENRLRFPRIQGADIAGRIVAAGAGVFGGTWLLPRIHDAQADFKAKRFVGKRVLIPDRVLETE